MRGLNDSERGQIGVRRIHATIGDIIEPPADREYAVDPVGDEKISPSVVVLVRKTPSINISRLAK